MQQKSNNYNSSERFIARLSSASPGIKKILKIVYQYVNWFLRKKQYKYKCPYTLKEVSNESSHESFFGYYDKSPESPFGSHIIYHSSLYHTAKNPEQSAPLKIVLQDNITGSVLARLPSNAYNWQQGTKAQWLNDDLFAYNDFDEAKQRYIARVFSASKLLEVNCFDFPIQDCYGTDFFLSLNYRRLLTLRPDYGYRNLPELDREELVKLSNDGVWRVEYKTGKSQLLISLEEISSLEHKAEFLTSSHKVNHIMISPDGANFIFVHRYFQGGRRFDRLILADAQNGRLNLLCDYGMVSHYFWVNNQTILAYMRGPGNVDSYWLVNIDSLKFSRIAHLDGLGDGHPHVYGDWFVTDTYPDKARMQQLNLLNWKTGKKIWLGEYFHGFKYSGESRCDLHPRFGADGKSVFIDSIFDGKRKLYKVDLE